MTITERSKVTAALRRALALSPARAAAIAAVAQARDLPEAAVAECWPRCCFCQVELAPVDEHFNDGRCDACEREACAEVADLIDAGQPPRRLAHVWDDDACCTVCGIDGAEIWHQTQFCGYEAVDSDRWCSERERRDRLENCRA